MKILLVNTHRSMLKGYARIAHYFQPLTLQQLAAVTPSIHEVVISDEGIQKVDYDKYDDFDIIGISITTPHAIRGYEIADEFRKRGKVVILGGFHPSGLPHEAKQHADSVVIGQADELWEIILKDYENRKLQNFYCQDKILEGNKIKRPNRKITNKIRGTPVVQANRGCPTGCKYCSISNMKFGNHPVFRPLEDVVNEIKSIKNKYIFLCDPSFTIDVTYSKELFKRIKNFNKRLIWINGNVHVLSKDDELLKLSSEAGCLEWLIGFESISQESLSYAGKNSNKIQNYETAIKKIHDHGMNVRGEFIFGFDTDTPQIFSDTVKLIKELNIDVMDFYTLVPFPGTPIYEKMENEGRLLTKDWSKYNGLNVVFQPKNMTPEELLNGTIQVGEEMHSYKRIFNTFFSNLNRGSDPFGTIIQNYMNRQGYLAINKRLQNPAPFS